MKKNNVCCLVRLYLSFHINKVLCIIFFISMIIWIIILLLSSGMPISSIDYLSSSTIYHLQYFEDSLFFMQLINSAFISFLIGSEASGISSFDSMFVSTMERKKIVIAKLLSNMFLLITLILLEVIGLYTLAVVIYPSYIFHLSNLDIILFQLLLFFEFILLGEFLSVLMNSYFISFILFIFQILILLLGKLEKIQKVLVYFFPKIVLETNQF
nr:hypothetical protein [Anaeroplasmataceae bacterium]